MTQTTRSSLTPADDAEIRQLYPRMLASWQDARAYAECFTPDADYIIANGKLEHGWDEIISNHELIFGARARNSHLEGRIYQIRYITADVAILTAYGHIEYDDHRSSELNKRTIYTLTALRRPEGWRFVAYQNTPLGTR